MPSENTSGKSRRQGGISKCGNPHARWLLVEQATHYRVPPKVSPQLSERQRGRPRWIRELSWKTQTRLSHRFSVLRKRGLHHNKIKTAVARELTAFVWERRPGRPTTFISGGGNDILRGRSGAQATRNPLRIAASQTLIPPLHPPCFKTPGVPWGGF